MQPPSCLTTDIAGTSSLAFQTEQEIVTLFATEAF
jgi:hypothetical protein